MRFQQTPYQGLRQLFFCILGPQQIARHTRRCPSFSVVLEATYMVGSEAETRELLGGTEEKSLPQRGGRTMIFYQKGTEKN